MSRNNSDVAGTSGTVSSKKGRVTNPSNVKLYVETVLKPKKSYEKIQAYINDQQEAANKYVETPELKKLNEHFDNQLLAAQHLKTRAETGTGLIGRAALANDVLRAKRKIDEQKNSFENGTQLKSDIVLGEKVHP
ncbi:hypothetical protein H0H81_003641 [Sphagnurus paluster]|uniref:Uncharacterized protein n=1 Tax=Sphagnurus paluster TaxID=117069 RepID=A0A9P7FT55_9AGAR|nr:hypothetical protein H0H81_003641 [Sphagnurus paluster]